MKAKINNLIVRYEIKYSMLKKQIANASDELKGMLSFIKIEQEFEDIGHILDDLRRLTRK